ncbi:MAG: tetratricopeptide repeat protein [Chloroflexota bacterium]
MFSPDLAGLLADLRQSKEELLQDPDLPPAELRDHESVLVTLNSSYRRLQQRDPAAAAFFPLLALFPAGLSETGLAAIFEPAARRHLRTIKELSLLEIAPPLDCYYLPAPVRSFAGRKLGDWTRSVEISEERPASALESGLQSGLQGALARYGPAALRHSANLAGQYNHLIVSGQPELSIALTALELPNLNYWLAWGYAGEQVSGDGACLTARICASLRNFYIMADLLRDEAIGHYRRALAASVRLQDRDGQANTLKSLGDLDMRVDQLEAARHRYSEALALFKAIDDKLGQANTLVSWGDLQDKLGQPEEALKHYQAGLVIFEQIGDRYSMARTILLSVGPFFIRRGQAEAAFQAYAGGLLVTLEMDFQFFWAFLNGVVQEAQKLVPPQPAQAAAGCAALLAELQKAEAEVTAEEIRDLLGLTGAIFQVIGLAGLAVGQTGPERANRLAQAQDLARQVDGVTGGAFGLVAWVGEVGT